MDTEATLTILGADRVNDSLIIAFSDGRSGQYSTQLLYATLASAKELFDVELPEALAETTVTE